MLTRRKAQAQEWQAQLAGAAELPEQVQLHILRQLVGCSSFAQLNALQRVSKTWHSTIRCDAAFLKQLRAAKLCALEQKAWDKAGKGPASNKKLPASFELPFLTSSSTVTSIPFRINKKYKQPSLFVVEAHHSSASPSQVLSLLQTMCELEGAVCAMLFQLEFPADGPAEWVQQIKEGAAAITSPTTVNVVTSYEFALRSSCILRMSSTRVGSRREAMRVESVALLAAVGQGRHAKGLVRSGSACGCVEAAAHCIMD